MTDRLGRALAAIDDANAADPHTVVVDGVARPKELLHADRMIHWLGVLAPDAHEAQVLACLLYTSRCV